MNILKQISSTINNREFSIKYWEDGLITIYLYETEVPIDISTSNNVVLDCENYNYALTMDMLEEIYAVMSTVKENIEKLRV